MWIALTLILVVTILHYFLGAKLFMLPKNPEYYRNVKNINTIHKPEIAPDPQYILLLTLVAGIAMGLFIALVDRYHLGDWYNVIFILLITCLYGVEISRRIRLTDNSLVLEKALSKTKEIPLDDIEGMYLYSYGKKFMKRHSFTTKLVVATDKEKIKFTISSLNNKAILNMMKNNFGIENYKMYIVK